MANSIGMNMIIKKWIVINPLNEMKGCLFLLPGRSCPSEMMEQFYFHADLQDTLLVIPEPYGLSWYDMPNGPNDQENAISSLKIAVKEVDDLICLFQKSHNLERNQIAIAGYSAGGVISLEVMSKSKQAFACAFCLSGAILDIDNFPKAKNKTPILIRHAVDDDCFDWHERYLPMKNKLIENDYNFYCSEKYCGGHSISYEDADCMGKFIRMHLGYKNIRHRNE